MTPKQSRDIQITSVDPWTADGPGWSNSGVTVRWRHPLGEEGEVTIYRNELPRDAQILFIHAQGIVADLKQALVEAVQRAVQGKNRG